MKRILFVTAILMALLFWAAPAAAQESSSTEELFSWFPIGQYRAYKHVDRAALESSEAFPVLSWNFNVPYMMYKDEKLPPSLRDSYNSETSATICQEKYKKGEGWVVFSRKPREEQEELLKKGECPQPSERDDLLTVFSYDDLDSLIALALKNGEIDTTGELVLERPIYSYSTPATGGIRYAYATATQEFLTASKPQNLRAMIAAGHGLELNLLDEESNVGMLEIIPHLGQYWKITNSRVGKLRDLERDKIGGVSEEVVDWMQDRIDNGTQLAGYSWKVDDTLTEMVVFLNGDPEHFEARMIQKPLPGTKIRDDTPEYVKTYASAKGKRTVEEFSADDRIRIVSCIYDEELLVEHKKSMEADEELKKQREAAAKQEKDKSGKR